MSTKRLEHLKEWDKIYLEVEKVTTKYDDEKSICFESNCKNSIWVSDDDTFYTLADLKQLANDGIPKQGEMIEAKCEFWEWRKTKFICFLNTWDVLCRDPYEYDVYDEWRFLPKVKTELTLAEVESRLGLDAWSLIIK